MKHSTNRKTTLLSLLLIAFLASFSPATAQIKENGGAVGTKVIQSSDRVGQLTVPADWNTANGLNESASIQVSNPSAALYAIVITDAKEDLATSWKLESYGKDRLQKLTDSLTDFTVSEPAAIMVDGHHAVLYEVHGTISGIRASYYFAVIETERFYHQIGIWTLRSRFPEKKPVMRAVIDGFRETPAGAKGPLAQRPAIPSRALPAWLARGLPIDVCGQRSG